MVPLSSRPRGRESLRSKALRRRRKLMLGIFFVLVVFGAAWTVVMTPVFAVRSVRVIGAERVSSVALEEALRAHTAESPNIVFAPLNRWAGKIKERFPDLKSARIRRQVINVRGRTKDDILANALTLSVSERRLAGVTCKEECFAFDEEGILVRRETATTSVAVITEKRNVAYALGFQMFDPARAGWLETLVQSFPWQGIGLERAEFGDEETTIRTVEGWSIIFANDRSVAEQLEAARILLEHEVGTRRPALEYIDVTIKNRVYYRFR